MIGRLSTQISGEYTDLQIGEMPTWIRTMKEWSSTVTYQEYEAADMNSFSEMQILGFNIVESHIKSPTQMIC